MNVQTNFTLNFEGRTDVLCTVYGLRRFLRDEY
jgi:hypothetical protein